MILAFFVLLLSAPSFSALPPDAQSYLNQIPEKKLTLPFVIQMAIQNAEAYRVIAYDQATATLEELGQVSSLTDTYLQAGTTYSDENSVKTNPFQPLRTKQWQWDVGLQKSWATGTQTKLGWVYDNNELEFDGSLGGFANTFLSQYKQSAVALELQQNLLKDSFGSAFRAKRSAARERAKAIQWKAREDIENLTLNFIVEYYKSWLLQQQVASVEEQVKRQERLLRVLRVRSQKGAVEKPDLLQVEALLVASQSRFQQVKADLSSQWERLVLSLDFPTSFLSVDPMDVPTTIDNPVPLSVRLCGSKEPVKSAQWHSLAQTKEGLDADLKAAKSESLPDLKLLAGYRGNSIDNQASTTFENVLKGRDDNGFGLGPTWNVGLRFVMPLENSASRALRAQKYVQMEQTAARLAMLEDDLSAQWSDVCRRLKVEVGNEASYQRVVDQQKMRVRGESTRFELGRVRVNQLVTAEDDLGSWEFAYQQKAVEVRQLAWQVQKLSGELYRQLSPVIETAMEANQNAKAD